MNHPSQPAHAAALVLLCVAQFVVVLDFSIINVALPSIQVDLGATTEDLQWIVGAYALTFGGLLLVGGRAADRFGQRLMFMAGMLAFSLASCLGGLASSEEALVAARALQGAGAAIISPAALSLISTTFPGDAERRRAFAVFAAAGSAAFAAGVVFGGILTDALSWRWVFFVNVPVGALALVLAPALLPEQRNRTAPRLDLPGAITATVGFLALIYALTEVERAGWGSAQTIALLVAAAVLLAGFVAIERRTQHPLVPLRLFRGRALSGANGVMFLASAAFYPMFVIVSQYMQRVLDYSALETGLAFVPMAFTVMLCSGYLSNKLVAISGVRPVLVAGMSVMAAGLLVLTQSSESGSFLTDVLPGTLIVAAGIGTSFTAILLAATGDVPESDQGVASGLINTAQQVGGAVGIAGLITLASARTDAASGSAREVLLAGYHGAFAAAGAVVALAAVVAWVAFRSDGAQAQREHAATADPSASA